MRKFILAVVAIVAAILGSLTAADHVSAKGGVKHSTPLEVSATVDCASSSLVWSVTVAPSNADVIRVQVDAGGMVVAQFPTNTAQSRYTGRASIDTTVGHVIVFQRFQRGEGSLDEQATRTVAACT